jgi:hypothetical protein
VLLRGRLEWGVAAAEGSNAGIQPPLAEESARDAQCRLAVWTLQGGNTAQRPEERLVARPAPDRLSHGGSVLLLAQRRPKLATAEGCLPPAALWGTVSAAVSAEGRLPGELRDAVSAEGRLPTTLRGTISAEGRLPTALRGTMSTEGRLPAALRGTISAEGRLPTALRGTISAEGRLPTALRDAVSAEGRLPTTGLRDAEWAHLGDSELGNAELQGGERTELRTCELQGGERTELSAEALHRGRQGRAGERLRRVPGVALQRIAEPALQRELRKNAERLAKVRGRIEHRHLSISLSR